MRSFTGHTQVSTTIAIPGQPKVHGQAEARIAFVRPVRRRVKGAASRGGQRITYLVVSDGKNSWLKASFLPRVEETADASTHIAAVTGIACQASTSVPALLMRQAWGYRSRVGSTL